MHAELFLNYFLYPSSAVTDFTVTKERSEVMTFSDPVTQIYHSLFINNPAGRPHYTAYTQSFHKYSWIAVIIALLATPPLLYLAVK